MNWHLANPALLIGMAGIAIPVIIHLLNRRRTTVIDWGAMQFLDLGRRARRRFQLTELLLMAGRMLLLALVALAVTKPFWTPAPAVASATAASTASTGPRDVVLIVDGSASMGRRIDRTSPRELAIAWARSFVGQLAPGSSIAVLDTRDRVVPLVAPPSFDRVNVAAALASAAPPRGASDVPAALAAAFPLFDRAQNASRDVIILTDGQAFPWRPGEQKRWGLIRELHNDFARRKGGAPRIWDVDFAHDARLEGADGSVGPLELARGLAPPGGTIDVRTTVANNGPGSLVRTAELLVDGQPAAGAAQAIGPIPAGGKAPLKFTTAIAEPGSHLLTVRLVARDDPIPINDESARPIEVTKALPVLFVDGEPGREPLTGETDFLRAALAPTGDDTPQVRTKVVTATSFAADSLKEQKVVVLANVERLEPHQAAPIAAFLAQGGGVLIAPGDRTDVDYYNDQLFQAGAGWLPARLGDLRGDASRRAAVAHPAPASFLGSALGPFAVGKSPPLADADLFAYRVLAPVTRVQPATVLARLDTGDPWIVERPYRLGRVAMLAGPVDAEGGTLPVNPDFVPWAHELVYHLADPSAADRTFHAGEPISVELDSPPAGRVELDVRTPSGSIRHARIERAEGRTHARLDEAWEPGAYRFLVSGGPVYAFVPADPREADLAPLSASDQSKLAHGWPLVFESQPGRLPGRLLATAAGGPNPIWRGLILAALGGLCMEVWLTRRVARSREVNPGGPAA
jgi:hypothetical protein